MSDTAQSRHLGAPGIGQPRERERRVGKSADPSGCEAASARRWRALLHVGFGRVAMRLPIGSALGAP